MVDDVTIDLPPGKVISLIGPNGAGKSTVLGMISRLIARTAGIVEFKGRDITHWERTVNSPSIWPFLTQATSYR